MGTGCDFDTFRPRGTEEVFQALEDNQVALSTMKASRFVKAFEKDVDHWERCLSLILEVIEMVLTVQRQWTYLEVGIHCTLFLLLYLHRTWRFSCWQPYFPTSRVILHLWPKHLTPCYFLSSSSPFLKSLFSSWTQVPGLPIPALLLEFGLLALCFLCSLSSTQLSSLVLEQGAE